MGVTREHSLAEAARLSGRHTSQVRKLLQTPASVALSTWQELAQPHATRVAQTLHALPGLPWTSVLLLDSPHHHRASLHPENAKQVKHGQGFVMGHQWTTSVLSIHDRLIPLPPIPSQSQR